MKKKTVIKLINHLLETSKIYYQGSDTPLMSDDEFDRSQELLNKIRESGEYPELFTKGSNAEKLLEGAVALGTVPENLTASHSTPMLSLAKAKEPKELEAFLNKARAASNTKVKFKIQPKLDGLALAVKYDKGELKQILTRGDGNHGEDVTFLLQDPNVSIVGLPQTIPNLNQIEYRGEIFFTTNQFKNVNDYRLELTGGNFKNSRNAAAGLLRKSELGVEHPVEFTFVIYSVLENGEPVELSKTVEGTTNSDQLLSESYNELTTNNEVMKAVENFQKIRETLEYPTDGVVIKPENETLMNEIMGSGNSHPHSQIAWKYPTMQVQSEILEITTTVGKSGRVTPRAQITPVNIDGSTVEYASLHNFNVLDVLDARVGSVVLVEKANEIIPQVVQVIENDENTVKIVPPTNCPACNTKLVGQKEANGIPRTLLCPNDSCESRSLFALKTAVGRGYLDIEGLSVATLTALFEQEIVTNLAELYELNLVTLANLETTNGRRVGEKTATKILAKIEESKTLPPHRIIASLAISGLGRTISKTILKELSFEELLNATVKSLEMIEGIGNIRATSIVNGLERKKPIINEMIAKGVIFEPIIEETLDKKVSNISGMAFSISGSVPSAFRNRGELVEWIETNGGSFHSSPKSSTTHMIGDSSEASAKVKKANSLGLTFVDPENFASLFMGSNLIM